MTIRLIKYTTALLMWTAALLPPSMPAAPAQAKAVTDGVVYRDKHVRLTVVADGMMRLEYEPRGRFVDDKSLIAVNRTYPASAATVADDGKVVTVATPKMVLTYKKSKGPFTADNLTISSAPGVTPAFTWTPGMEQQHNLLGTTRTLDGWDGDRMVGFDANGTRQDTPGTLEPGLLARDGWTLIDDSNGLLFDGDPDFEWVKERRTGKGAIDWYFLAYGHDYKGALADFTVLSGKMPLPPRYAFGYWWSRWWAYSEHEFNDLLDNFASYQIPIDVLVIDMDWHYTDAEHGGWTGWTWNRRLFPAPEKFLNSLRDRDLKVTLNLHPADGVKRFEASYPEIAAENGVDPSTGQDIPWITSDKRFMQSMFNHILDPMKREGVSFWWLDWQQELNDPVIKDLSNTFWLNYAFFTRMQQTEQARPLIYHRWGGLGNHRYQIGFSGDNYVNWRSLDFLPYFTATASNVCYGYWSHDLGGHYLHGDTITNPELYIRWMQFGAYSPIMRTHSNKNANLKKEPWRFDFTTMKALRQSIQRRYEMLPYIYAMSRKSHDTGVSLCRPMYYDYPEAEEAYRVKNQYMFGDQMIVAPVTAPGVNGYSSVEVWLPQGQWYELATGTLLDGGATYTRSFALNETPVYIKAGAVVPYHADKVMSLRNNDEAIAITVYPGASGEFTLYEDNGDDNSYDTAYATTRVTAHRSSTRLTVAIEPRKGSYDGMPSERRYEVRVPAGLRPVAVTVDGTDAPYEYLPEELCTVVKLPAAPCSQRRSVVITTAADATVADGTIGSMKRFVETFGQLKDHEARICVNEDFGSMSTVYEALKWYPENNREILATFRNKYADIKDILNGQTLHDATRTWFLTSLGKAD